MTGSHEFEIAFLGLKPGITVFEYELGDMFFDAEKSTDFQNCLAKVRLLLDKHAGFLQLKFEVGGKTDMQCSRCGNSIGIDLWDDFDMVVKIVDNAQEMNDQNDDPDVFFISRNESHLNVKDWIFEFIQLSMPTHPMCDESEIGGPQCNKEVLEMLEKLKESVVKKETSIWKGLDKFRDN